HTRLQGDWSSDVCSSDLTGTFPTNAQGVPTSATTPSSAQVTGQAAVNLGIAACGTLADPLRPYPGYGTITHLELKSSSVYHALRSEERRVGKGVRTRLVA